MVVQPLPRESYPRDKTCVDPWFFGIPKELKGVPDEQLAEVNTTDSPSWITDWLEDLDDLITFLKDTRALEADEKGEGLLLLAHHNSGNLWFKTPTQRAIREDFRRRFPPGSVVLLAACSAVDLEGDNQAMLEDFNQNGIDGMVLSPFPVPAEYGSRLALEFANVIRRERGAGGTPTLAELFSAAAKKTADLMREKTAKHLDEMALEFLILGDHGLRLCAP